MTIFTNIPSTPRFNRLRGLVRSVSVEEIVLGMVALILGLLVANSRNSMT